MDLHKTIAMHEKRTFKSQPEKYSESPDYIFCRGIKNALLPNLAHAMRQLRQSVIIAEKSELIDHTELIGKLNNTFDVCNDLVETLRELFKELAHPDGFSAIFGAINGEEGEDDE